MKIVYPSVSNSSGGCTTELGENGFQAMLINLCEDVTSRSELCSSAHVDANATCLLFPAGCGEVGAGSREWLPHREGETNRLELQPAPHSYPALHL